MVLRKRSSLILSRGHRPGDDENAARESIHQAGRTLPPTRVGKKRASRARRDDHDGTRPSSEPTHGPMAAAAMLGRRAACRPAVLGRQPVLEARLRCVARPGRLASGHAGERGCVSPLNGSSNDKNRIRPRPVPKRCLTSGSRALANSAPYAPRACVSSFRGLTPPRSPGARASTGVVHPRAQHRMERASDKSRHRSAPRVLHALTPRRPVGARIDFTTPNANGFASCGLRPSSPAGWTTRSHGPFCGAKRDDEKTAAG